MARSILLTIKIQALAAILSIATLGANAQGAPLPGTSNQSELEVVTPGPMAAERQKVLDMIYAAKEQKIGITAYMGAFKILDDSVKAGAQEKEIKGRLTSISESLSEQLKRSKELKSQRPAPPIAASSPSASEAGGGKSSLSGDKTDKIIEKLKDKWFGGEIPDSIKKKIPAGIDPNKLDNDTIKDLLKKYGG